MTTTTIICDVCGNGIETWDNEHRRRLEIREGSTMKVGLDLCEACYKTLAFNAVRILKKSLTGRDDAFG